MRLWVGLDYTARARLYELRHDLSSITNPLTFRLAFNVVNEVT